MCVDDPRLKKWAGRTPVAFFYYTHENAVWEIRDAEVNGWTMTGKVFARSREVAGLRLGVIGTHNLQNAAAAIAAADACGISPDEACRHLASFPGARRRMERIGTYNGVLILDDFSHHPSEVTASLRVLRRISSGGRVIVVFQPHRYARTRMLKDHFAGRWRGGRLFVTEIYAGPGEVAEEGVVRGVSERWLRPGREYGS